jgi:hypothetical protein
MTPRSPREFAHYDAVDSVVRGLPLLPAEAPYALHLVDYLALMGLIIREKGGDLRAAPHFQPASAKTVINELNELRASLAALAAKNDRRTLANQNRRRLAQLVRALYSPTIEALSAAEPVLIGGHQILADTAYFQSGFPEILESDAAISSNELRFWAAVAEAAMQKRPHGRDAGRPQNALAHNVAAALARRYQGLTGRDPTFIVREEKESQYVSKDQVSGEFLIFARKIFELLGIRGDALSYVAKAARELRGKGRKK